MPLTGGDDVVRRIQGVAKLGVKAAGAGLYAEGHRIMAISKLLCPLRWGPLRASGTVHTPEIDGDEVSVTLSYGGASAKYAVAVHERLQATHWTEPGTGPKYLERPVRDAESGLAARVGGSVKGVL